MVIPEKKIIILESEDTHMHELKKADLEYFNTE